MKSTIMKLKEKTKTWLSPRHPFHEMELQLREYYAAAILLQTQLSEEVTPMDNFELLRLFTFGLRFGRDEVKEVILFSKNRENVLEQVLNEMDTPEKQTIFLMDLLNISYTGYGYGAKEAEAIDIYGELFQFPKVNVRLLKDLIQAAREGQEDECMRLYSNMAQIHMDCSLEQIRYYIPELSYTTVVDAKALDAHKSLVIHGECEIREPLVVPKNGQLVIQNASIRLMAPIIVEGGKLEIIDSELTYFSGDYHSMIDAKENASVVIRNTQFYCHNRCSVLKQVTGMVDAIECSVFETNMDSAFHLQWVELVIANGHFVSPYHDGDGAAIFADRCKGIISKCRFDKCHGVNGGAIYAEAPVEIQNCVFTNCQSRELGHSIYYVGYSKDYVTGCIYESTDVDDHRMQMIQVVENEKTLLDAKELSVSTLFKKPITLGEEHTVYIHDVCLLLAAQLRIAKGGLLERCHLKAYGLAEQDLLDVSNGSPIEIKECVFDGLETHGGLNAVGTKVSLYDCTFKNTGNGRAVFQSVDLLCENSIFSNCLGGAIYGSRAMIKNSIFVNCRANHGAGVYLVSSKGLIKHCKFERCIANVSGGGMSLFGNYPVENCTYIECKPE